MGARPASLQAPWQYLAYLGVQTVAMVTSFNCRSLLAVRLISVCLITAIALGGCLAFGRYSSPTDWPAFSLDPPQGWGISQFGPSKDDGSRGVTFLGETSSGRSPIPNISVIAIPRLSAGGPYSTYRELFTKLQQRASGPDTKIIRSGPVVLAGEPGLEIVYDYMEPTPAYNKRDAARSWEIATQHNDHIFLVGYKAPREDFDKYAPLFRKVLETFRFER